jgi:outer membrane immunogenic protein
MIRALFVPALVAAALAAGSAAAADLAAQPVEPVAPVVTPYDWSGPYIGLHAGYAWGRETDNQSTLYRTSGQVPIDTPRDLSADKIDLDGFVGGAHAGYNHQFGQFVLGAEGDLDFADIEGSQRFAYSRAIAGVLGLKSDWQGSARLRTGYAIDNILLFATGGIAVANAELSAFGVDDSNTHIGWTVGLGGEYAFTQNWIGRAEVRYSDFAKKSYQTQDGAVKAGWDQTTTTLGVSYKF